LPSVSEIVRTYQATGEKLSSQQDFGVLDELLARAVEPLEAETEAYFEWLGEVVAFSLTSRRRLNHAVLSAAVAGLCGQQSGRAVIDAGIDRGHVFSLLKRVSQVGDMLEKAQLDCLRRLNRRVSVSVLKDIKAARDRLGDGSLTAPAARASRYWYCLARRHKRSIIYQFLRKLAKTASQISHASGKRIEKDPAFHDAFLAAWIAADRFRADSGVFAPYLGNYLRGSSRVSASYAIGLAAPGARVASADALQAGPLDEAAEIVDVSNSPGADDSLIRKIDAVSSDPDVRAALMVSDVQPPAAIALARRSKSVRNSTGVHSE
jgi:hypothetical protein